MALQLFLKVFTSHKQHLNMQHKKSQVAATDIVLLSTRHNKRADKMQPHRFLLALWEGRVQDNVSGWGAGSDPTIKWNLVCVCVCEQTHCYCSLQCGPCE